jgi:hypothetical protein
MAMQKPPAWLRAGSVVEIEKPDRLITEGPAADV